MTGNDNAPTFVQDLLVFPDPRKPVTMVTGIMTPIDRGDKQLTPL